MKHSIRYATYALLLVISFVLLKSRFAQRKQEPVYVPVSLSAPKEELIEGSVIQRDMEYLEHSDIQSISLARTGCFGECPIYQVTFMRSGDVRLEAKRYMPLSGVFEGKISEETFGRLCYAFEKLGFSNFGNAYIAPWTDDSTCVVTITTKKGQKEVSDYGSVGPVELWVLQNTLDRIREGVDWAQVKEPSTSAPTAQSAVR
jgi:Domain of unknown function (DUF6438)